MESTNRPPHLEVPTCDDRPIWDLWLSAFHGATLAAADEMGIFPLLARAPLTAEEVSRELELTVRATEALLGLLTSLRLLALLHGRYHLTELSRNYLVPTSPYYWGGFLRRFREVPITSTAIRNALKGGRSETKGAAANLWVAPDREKLRIFTDAMHSHSFAMAVALATRLDMSGVQRLLDVGGGSGCFCIAFATRHPQLRFTVMDLPIVCEIAQEYITSHSLEDRIDTCGIDMFKSAWPKGYDAVFFNDIFHDWEDALCLELARHSLEILPRGGRILVHEMLLADAKDGPLPAASYSMAMIFSTDGKQRTAAEVAVLLERAGFVKVSVTPSAGYYSLVSGEKP